MQAKPIGSSVNINLVITVLVDAIKDYRRRWRLFVGILALGWWPMIAVEVWLLGAFGEPFLHVWSRSSFASQAATHSIWLLRSLIWMRQRC